LLHVKRNFPPALAFSSGKITRRSKNPTLHNSKTKKDRTEERRDTDEETVRLTIPPE
jgi:hypothetical protein